MVFRKTQIFTMFVAQIGVGFAVAHNFQRFFDANHPVVGRDDHAPALFSNFFDKIQQL